MQTPTIVIEPTDSAIKIVVGYVLNNEPVVLYASTIETDGLITNGNITDIKSLTNLLREISHVEDKDARVRFDIKNAVVVLPPVGLEIYEDKKSTSVVSNAFIISQTDISNILLMMQKSQIKSENSFVDFIPTMFYLSHGKTEKIPINFKSDYLGMKALIYTLPTRLINGYRACFESSGIRITKNLIAPCNIAHLLARRKDTPTAYLFVDIGSSYTSISLISKTFVYNSSCFLMGGDGLTKNIADAFRIDLKEAEKLKRRYGYDSRLFSFNPTIASAMTVDGKEALYTVRDLNHVIKDYLDNYIFAFDACLNNLLSFYPEEKRNFPMIIGGAASRLDGLVDFFKNKYPNRNISSIPLDIIGTRHEKYLNCVGALLATINTISLNDFSRNSQNFNRNSIANKVRKVKL